MSKAVYVEAKESEAVAVLCEDCDRNEWDSLHEGAQAIKQHQEAFPLHTRFVWLKMEIVEPD
jgi:hypothetical protein